MSTLLVCAVRSVVLEASGEKDDQRITDPFLLWSFLVLPIWLLLSGLEYFLPHMRTLVLFCKALVIMVPVIIPVQKKGSENVTIIPEEFGISARELEVLLLVRKGYTNQEIAEALYISVVTVKTHLTHLFEKTNARNRVELLNAIERKRENTTLG